MENTEVVANLWYLIDEATGLIYRLFGRAYVMSGTEEDKITVLKALSMTDHLAAQGFPVPKRFSVVDGLETIEGYCSPGLLDDFMFELYEEVFEYLDATMPLQAVFEDGEIKAFKMQLPGELICVSTPLIEDEDGSIRPQL